MSSTSLDSFDCLNILLKKLAANASMLTDLSIEILNLHHDDDTVFLFDKCPLPLSLFNLPSLRLDVMCPSLYRDLPKMQPNLKHLDLVIYDYDDCSESDQIISLIKNLKILEIFHIKIKDYYKPADELRSESVIRQVFDACSKKRPTLHMYVQYNELGFSIFGVKLNFMDRKSTVTHIPFELNYLSDSLEHQSLLRC
ncbi:uncharacterized protein LOC119068845 [Bradysia coprophila]|uniref:uncharacterized protein LOC119068845 n=1 Tax=Bradysia coprophila TaxID=38358 RepID=UPI00187D9F8A|nr:uncharacterized protein LOC119068845 [Bradysia coprophila]